MGFLHKSFPFCPQHDSMQCGAACLQMVCQWHGKHFALERLSDIYAHTHEGVSLYGLSTVATSLGFRTACVKATVEQLAQATLPCILHWNQNHFVVLHRVNKHGQEFHIADPAKGLRVLGRQALAEHWASIATTGDPQGIVMLLQPTAAFHQHSNAQEQGHGQERSLRFLLGHMRQYARPFRQIALGMAVSIVIQTVLPFLTQSIVDVGIRQHDLHFVWLILIGQLTLSLSSTAIDFIQRWILLHISLRVNLSLLSDFFVKLLRLPMSFFDTKLMGDLIQRMSDHGRVNTFLTQQVLGIAFSMVTLLVFSLILLYYDSRLLLVFLAGSLVYGGWMARFLHRRKVLDYELFERQAATNNRTYDLITSMQEIKLQDSGTRQRWEWEDAQVSLFDVQMKALRLQQTQEAGSTLINELKNLLITVLSATAVINGQMTLGMMLAVQYIIGQLNGPVEQLMYFGYSMQDVNISLERINEIHHMQDEDDDSKHLYSALDDSSQGIVLHDVVFRYDRFSPVNTIDHVSLHIPQGQVTAIVGASGSGKSTLVKLILGYYSVLEGTITLGGTDIQRVNKEWWRRQCGVVMQDGAIFADTIARNIATGDENIYEARLAEATEVACIKEHILSLPLKFDTRIGRDGMGLSQGQKQRILIARAAYRCPACIFLDEATNSLDAVNERHIVHNMDTLFQGKTVVVAHRLSTVRNAHQIIVLDHGRVVETGTHEELTRKHGAYYRLVKNQLELGN